MCSRSREPGRAVQDQNSAKGSFACLKAVESRERNVGSYAPLHYLHHDSNRARNEDENVRRPVGIGIQLDRELFRHFPSKSTNDVWELEASEVSRNEYHTALAELVLNEYGQRNMSKTKMFPNLSEEKNRHAVSVIPANNCIQNCWTCREEGHRILGCPLLSVIQLEYFLYRYYLHQMEANPQVAPCIEELLLSRRIDPIWIPEKPTRRW